MNSRILMALVVFMAAGLFLMPQKPHAEVSPAPEFTQTNANAWLNSEPLSMQGLRGKVVMLDVWTFDCWNCYRSFPWMNEFEQSLAGKPFQIIGIHTPEFDHERERTNVAAKIKEFELRHPVMMDNDFGYWKALNNRYWPAFYVIDKKGMIRGRFIGETHAGDRNAKAISKLVNELLEEPA